MEFESEKTGASMVVKVKGRMDATTAGEFEQEMARHMEAGEKNFVVDLAGLQYISSAGLRAILTVAKKLKSGGGQMAFCRLQGIVQEVFSLAGFSSMFALHDSLEAALGQA